MDINFKTITGHLIFWIVYFLYVWLPQGSIDDNFKGFFYFACLNVPITMIATYYTINVTVDKFLLHKKTWQFWASLAFSLVAFAFIRRYVNYTFMYPMLWPKNLSQPLFYFPKMIFDAVNVHLIAAVGAMIYLIGKWNEQQHLAEKLTKEKVAAELELLKSQVQPHFIFNTLNNIYMLSLKKSSQTSDMIYRLSALLSYMLYDSKKAWIPIEKEIDYIKNYINLEKIRYGKRLDVQLNVFSDVEQFSVPPLLMLPLVENAFKHGVSNEVANCWIHIDIMQKHNSLIFKIENSIVKKTAMNGFGNGLGLRNLEQRLEILFPDRFELRTMKEESSFLVTLKLDYEPSTEGVIRSTRQFEEVAV